MACIIVRRLLISVHKWQSSGMAATHEYWSQHDAHLVYLQILDKKILNVEYICEF